MIRKFLLISVLALLLVGAVSFIRKDKTPLNPAPGKPPAQKTVQSSVAKPKELFVNSIKINASFEYVGLDQQNRMDVPKDPADVGWYNLGPKPGEMGSAVIAGHLDDQTGAPAVFWNLTKLKKGDSIKVVDLNNKTYEFKVLSVTNYDFDKFPLQKVFADTSGKKLNLITCGGTWDKNTKNYSKRTVVYAQME